KERLGELETRIDELLVKLPNLPSDQVPPGRSASDNQIVREGGIRPGLEEDALPHWELAKIYGLIDFELGNKVTGSGFPFYTGAGARYQRSLIQYFLDYNIAAGYKEY